MQNQPKADPLLTQAKFDELENKLFALKQKRPQLAIEVSRLAELGDFSENVEYQLAKGRLRGLNHAMLKLENQLRQAIIISTPKKTGIVQIGSMVTVSNGKTEKTYQILGSSETDPQKGIISRSSPIGAALLGRKAGDTIEIILGGKTVTYTIKQTY